MSRYKANNTFANDFTCGASESLSTYCDYVRRAASSPHALPGTHHRVRSDAQFAEVDRLAATGADRDERERRIEQFLQTVEIAAGGLG